MVHIFPVSQALAPVDTAAANLVSAPNYDEFQSDDEIRELLAQKPDCVLRVTMPHCIGDPSTDATAEGSPAALALAAAHMQDLSDSPLMQTVSDILWVYEIVDPRRGDVRQLGLGGFAETAQIRTDDQPDGVIIRNEGIRQEKADGRARLIEATDSYIGTVNCAVRDQSGNFIKALEEYADGRSEDFQSTDEAGCTHRVWLMSETDDIERFTSLLVDEPSAYVADGNHRSAAAAALGREHFLAVFFTTGRMGLQPYNRLVKDRDLTKEAVLTNLKTRFEVRPLEERDEYRPESVHEIGLYTAGQWRQLIPRPEFLNADDAAASIDADIVQRHIFDAILGLPDPRDEHITFVGGDRDSAYLMSRVDSGEFAYAFSLAPVTMDQFIAVCEQGRFMPPKSTWFEPKIRSGLVIAMLGNRE